MKKYSFAVLASVLLFSCSNRGGLYNLAVKQLPITLETGMRDYMQTVGKPEIKDIEVIYDCDSLCVLQCRASAPDQYGYRRSETVRYFFVKDVFLSKASGKTVYGDFVTGGKILDKKGKKVFQKTMEDGKTEKYLYYLGMANHI